MQKYHDEPKQYKGYLKSALVDAIVDMKRRNPRWGCPRIAQQIARACAVDIDKDVVRRVLATHYRPAPRFGWSVLADIPGACER